MYRTRSLKSARQLAFTHNLFYGYSIFHDVYWYVGTIEQLKAIGVITPQKPKGTYEN